MESPNDIQISSAVGHSNPNGKSNFELWPLITWEEIRDTSADLLHTALYLASDRQATLQSCPKSADIAGFPPLVWLAACDTNHIPYPLLHTHGVGWV
jgi:hypothetical protein